VKSINYFLLAFILIFIMLSVFLEPVRFEDGKEIKFPNDLPEVKLNIPLDDKLLNEELSGMDIKILQDELKTSFPSAWTIKVSSYDDLTVLKRDLEELKKKGYKVYSQYEEKNEVNYSLFIGPTLNREDSIKIFEEISNIKKFKPEILRYD
tara:strand:+ start:3701 stop:4153 length:453 start_codon:yes stop_codon:yes gene_type:complete